MLKTNLVAKIYTSLWKIYREEEDWSKKGAHKRYYLVHIIEPLCLQIACFKPLQIRTSHDVIELLEVWNCSKLWVISCLEEVGVDKTEQPKLHTNEKKYFLHKSCWIIVWSSDKIEHPLIFFKILIIVQSCYASKATFKEQCWGTQRYQTKLVNSWRSCICWQFEQGQRIKFLINTVLCNDINGILVKL